MRTEIIPSEPDQGSLQHIHDDGEMSVTQLLAQVAKIQQVMQAVMKPGVHYGIIPGTSRIVDGREMAKPSLLKPGAEKLCLVFRLDPHFEHVRERDGRHLTVYSTCTLYHINTGKRMGSGNGSCSTRENKYAWRNATKACPECGKPAIIKGKPEYGGGWVCFKRKDGCGAKFDAADPRIADQADGKVENPDIADAENTVIKMADKRALIAAVLITTGASDFFTQDLEDLVEAGAQVDAADDAAATAEPAKPKASKSKSSQSPQGSKDAIEKGEVLIVHAKVVKVESRTGGAKPFFAVTIHEVGEDAEVEPYEAITFSSTDAEAAKALVGKEVAAEVQDCKQGNHEWTKLLSLTAVAPARDPADIPF